MSKLSDIKLIASDIDGTLLNDDSKLPDSFFEIYNELKYLGIEFVIASGRQMNNLREIFEPIKDELTYIAQNGSYILSKNEELYTDPIDELNVIRLILSARKIPNACILAYGIKSVYIENTSSAFLNMLRICGVSYEIVEDLLKISDDCILKISIYDASRPADNSYTYFSNLSSYLNFAISSNFWLDITSIRSNKGHALSVIQKHFNISHEQTMVFGDYENDLDMMSYAYFSYAMDNANNKVKKAARFVAPSNNENGVLKIIQNVIESIKISNI